MATFLSDGSLSRGSRQRPTDARGPATGVLFGLIFSLAFWVAVVALLRTIS